VRIAPEIYGQFSEQLGKGITDGIWVGENSAIPNIQGYRSDVVAALQALHVPVLRWPGGCYADTYHWRDGIGPRGERPVTLNHWWGNNEENNAFGTNEYFKFAQLIGSRTDLSVNVGTGTAGEAKDWIEYVSSPSRSSLAQLRRTNGQDAPWKIDYVAIGNESWGCGGNLTAEQYEALLRRYSTFLKQGSSPRMIAVGPSADDYHWTEAVMESRSQFDLISLHYYTLPTGDWTHKGAASGFSKAEWLQTFAQTRRMEELLARHSAIMDKTDPDKKVGIAVDEWGTWYDTPPGAPALRQGNTLRDALVAAVNFHIFHRYADRVRMANISQMVNVLQSPILTEGSQMVRTPTYYAFLMYRPFQGASAVPVEENSPDLPAGTGSIPAIDVTAANGEDGSIHVGLINLDPDEGAAIDLSIAGVRSGEISGELLTAAHMDSENRFGAGEEVHPMPFRGARWHDGLISVSMPPKSVVVLTLK
jgi:alpha-N-arabinofuranosidase